MSVKPYGNIQKVEAVDLAANGDYEREAAFFFIRVETAGDVKYCPALNDDNQAITKHFDASDIFVDPELCRKIFNSGTSASDIYVGFGL